MLLPDLMHPNESDSGRQLDAMFDRCVGAYSDITLRGYRHDLETFIHWCASNKRQWLPASPETLAAFIDHEIKRVSIATLKRRLAAIRFAHALSDLQSPVAASQVQLALRRAARFKARRPQQVHGLTAGLLDRMIVTCPNTLSGKRDAALLAVGYDTLCRSSELAAMNVDHVLHTGQRSAVFVPRSKGDVSGDGRVGYLSDRTGELLGCWMDGARIKNGPLFRGVRGNLIGANTLDTSTIRRLIKRAAKRADIDAGVTSRLSGHSMRVGAAQDMMVAGFDSLAIMQSGGWKTPHVVLRYVEHASTRQLHERRWERLRGVG
ncbi:MAG: tyrosine-type recombinase/integrase [Hyphomicrobiales bacterium]|jgi:integrase/recombinase XerD